MSSLIPPLFLLANQGKFASSSDRHPGFTRPRLHIGHVIDQQHLGSGQLLRIR